MIPPGKVSQELTEVRLALEREDKVTSLRSLVSIFWGLILAKCFLAEWAIQYYNMPFHSLYVWVPTVLFGALCTWVYAAAMVKSGTYRSILGRFTSALGIGCLITLGVFTVVGLGFTQQSLNPYLLPGLFSVVLGLGYFITSSLYRDRLLKVVAWGWWLGGGVLLMNPNLDALAWFSLMILLFQVGPSCFLYLQEKRLTRRNKGAKSV